MDKLAVDYTVMGIAPTHGSGRLVALANVEISICGIVVALQGVRIDRGVSGALSVSAPQFRDAAGNWRSAVILPDALRDALGEEVLAAYQTGALAVA